MPEMIVWPDSSSVRTRNDGSSCARRPSAMPIFSWSALVLGSTACEITGSGNTMRSSSDHVVGIAERLAGGDVLQADAGGDVAGAHFLDFRALVGVHLQQATDALLLALDRVVDRVAGVQHARIDADERQLADERVGHDLERERRELLAVVGLADGLGFAVVVQPLTGGMSTGDGRYSITASSIACTPLFLNAEPHSIGTISLAIVRWRRPFLIGPRARDRPPRGTCSSVPRWPRRRPRPSSRATPCRCRAARPESPPARTSCPGWRRPR